MKEYKFRVKNETKVYTIPSILFPVAGEDIEVFKWENTENITDDEIKEVFDNHNFRVGKCYYNCNDLLDSLEKRNIKGFKYYSGWFFLPMELPVHHSWLVKDGKYVLDFNNNVYSMELLAICNTCKSVSEMRSKIVDYMVGQDKKFSSETKIFGRLHKGYVFVGTKDTFENSLNIFKNLQDNHISYQNGLNQKGLSDLQKEVNRKN